MEDKEGSNQQNYLDVRGFISRDDDGDMKEVSEALCNALIDTMIEVVEAHSCSCMILFDVKEQEND